MSQKNDVVAILKAASDQYEEVKTKYEAALKDKSMDLRISVKILMEHLRSALDYMAHDIYDTFCKPSLLAAGQSDPHNIYFPYAKSEQDFRSRIGAGLSGLDPFSEDIFILDEL